MLYRIARVALVAGVSHSAAPATAGPSVNNPLSLQVGSCISAAALSGSEVRSLAGSTQSCSPGLWQLAWMRPVGIGENVDNVTAVCAGEPLTIKRDGVASHVYCFTAS